MVQLSTRPGPCGLRELPCVTYMCHNVSERYETSVSGIFL